MALAAMAEQPSLPTLLTSRQKLVPAHAVKPAPLLLAEPADAVVEGHQLRVRNTFIDTVDAPSPSMAGLRAAATCPSSCVGTLLKAFEDADVGGLAAPEDQGCSEELVWPGTATSIGRPDKVGWAQPPAQAPPPAAARPTLCLERAIEMARPFQGACPLVTSAPVWAVPEAPRVLHVGGGVPASMLPTYAQVFPSVPLLAPLLPVDCPAVSAAGYFLPGPAEEHIPSPPSRPAPGSDELPSAGSAGHTDGECKPCAFFHSGRCGSGLNCRFCHLCDADERKKRRREKLEAKKAAMRTVGTGAI